jgi:hypothetical protein
MPRNVELWDYSLLSWDKQWGRNTGIVLHSFQSFTQKKSQFCIAQSPESSYCEMLWIYLRAKLSLTMGFVCLWLLTWINQWKILPWNPSIIVWKLICVLPEGCFSFLLTLYPEVWIQMINLLGLWLKYIHWLSA